VTPAPPPATSTPPPIEGPSLPPGIAKKVENDKALPPGQAKKLAAYKDEKSSAQVDLAPHTGAAADDAPAAAQAVDDAQAPTALSGGKHSHGGQDKQKKSNGTGKHD